MFSDGLASNLVLKMQYITSFTTFHDLACMSSAKKPIEMELERLYMVFMTNNISLKKLNQ